MIFKINHSKYICKKVNFTIAFFLMAFLLINTAACQGKKANSEMSQAALDSKKTNKLQLTADHSLIVYYFHTTFRCASCNKMERFTKEALEKYFEAQLKNRSLIFKSVNLDNPGNEKFIQDYELFTKSIVLVDLIREKQIKWQRLDKSWNYLGSSEAFDKYFVNELTAFIKGMK